ncbi:hypothetical protein BGW37DRAFT_480186 [Umbelopsis sp. PMI_123]|nr:hypothetical protein BGW37DRAFT_480186 [Umbelopsis sp. PMI_123]
MLLSPQILVLIFRLKIPPWMKLLLLRLVLTTAPPSSRSMPVVTPNTPTVHTTSKHSTPVRTSPHQSGSTTANTGTTSTPQPTFTVPSLSTAMFPLYLNTLPFPFQIPC